MEYNALRYITPIVMPEAMPSIDGGVAHTIAAGGAVLKHAMTAFATRIFGINPATVLNWKY